MIDPSLIDPIQWSATFSHDPVLSSQPSRWKTGRVARWTGTNPDMPQPPLDHHVLVLHLGGDKHVRRSGNGLRRSFDVPLGGLTLIPAGCGFDWLTVGPVDFAHLYIHPDRLDQVAATVFDRDPTTVTLRDPVGVDDPLLRALATTILGEVGTLAAPRAYLDSLFDTALVTILRQYSNIADVREVARHRLAPARLRRVLEHVETTLVGQITLNDMAQAAGLSRFHFSRAFQKAVGEPPLAYVARRRIEVAKELLRTTSLPIADVAGRAGFNSAAYFSTAFKRYAGCAPSDYRFDAI